MGVGYNDSFSKPNHAYAQLTELWPVAENLSPLFYSSIGFYLTLPS